MRHQQYARAVAAVLFAALAGSASWATAQNKTQVQWLGQATTKITTPTGKVIVIDPWLTTNPKTPAAYKNLSALGKVDLILLTHGHFDHMADAPALAKLTNAPIYGPVGLMQSLVALGLVPTAQAVRFGKGGTVTPLGEQIKITQTRAEHSSEIAHKNAVTGKDEVHVGGEPAGFIIELEDGFKIYHMGDTGLFGDMSLIGSYYKPDLVLIPIGGHFVMSPKDAAMATRDMIKPKYAIPIHYGTSAVLKGTPAEYTAALGNSPTKVYVLEPGQAVEF